MILPSGVNKMSGLTAALREMQISPHNVVGIGDAENDDAFLGSCECAVAVANAIPAVREKADVVTQASHGEGVVEVIGQLIADELNDSRPACRAITFPWKRPVRRASLSSHSALRRL